MTGRATASGQEINKNNVKGSGTNLVVGHREGASPGVDDWTSPIVPRQVMYLAMPGVAWCTLDAASRNFLRQYRHQMARRRREPPVACAAGSCSMTTKPSSSPLMERSTPSTSRRRLTKAFGSCAAPIRVMVTIRVRHRNRDREDHLRCRLARGVTLLRRRDRCEDRRASLAVLHHCNPGEAWRRRRMGEESPAREARRQQRRSVVTGTADRAFT